jgi:predicted DNA binding CopG/RHH family protein
VKKKYNLESEEQKILESFENDEFVSVFSSERKKELIEMAKNTTKKSRRINIRLSERDFERINIKAIEENIPYQTLIGSLIHKYLDGRFNEKH